MMNMQKLKDNTFAGIAYMIGIAFLCLMYYGFNELTLSLTERFGLGKLSIIDLFPLLFVLLFVWILSVIGFLLENWVILIFSCIGIYLLSSHFGQLGEIRIMLDHIECQNREIIETIENNETINK